jgi:hypothetical protein
MRAWGFATLAEYLERLGSLRCDEHGEAIPDFQVGVWGWDHLIAVAMHRDQHTPGW